MHTIEVGLGTRSYPIHIGQGLLGDRDLLSKSTSSRQILVVTNETIAPLYLELVERAFADRELESFVLPDGEEQKTLASFARIIDVLIEHGFHRDSTIVALGGGVIGDIAGFAAASYQRGIDFVQLPTTLLAQVDSSVGGKTAVNHPQGKNMIGAFHQPIAVLADTDTLASLPKRELAAGLAEVIKYGLIEDEAFFVWLEEELDAIKALDPVAMAKAIKRCCEIKAAIVAQDEREHGKRALLNLGHTFGHAIESLGGYGRWLHGEAVAIGIAMAAEASSLLGNIDADVVGRADRLIERAGLPTRLSGLAAKDIHERMQMDKKAGASGLKLILLNGIGQAYVTATPSDDLVMRAIQRRIEPDP